MKKVAAFIILAFLSFTTISAADAPPASIHLELGKNILALAEPTTLAVEITNLMDGDLLLDNLYMFQLHDSPYHLSLFLITPDGKQWFYTGSRYNVEIMHGPDTKFYLSLPAGNTISRVMPLWWTTFLPYKYQVALEKLHPGTYRLFATYLLPEQNGLDNVTIYSDTIEFVFLPLNEKHLPVLIEMDSLYLSYITLVGSEIYQPLERIRDSRTPYSEDAHVRLILGWSRNYELFTAKKVGFDELYRESPYQVVLVTRQAGLAKRAGLDTQVDSLLEILSNRYPTHSAVLKYHNRVRLLTAREARSAK